MRQLIILLVFFTTSIAYAQTTLSDAQVREAVNAFIATQSFPQQLDSATSLDAIEASIRGIIYIYTLNFNLNEMDSNLLSAQGPVLQNQYCSNAQLYWYRDNNASMSYIYYTNDGYVADIFKVSNSGC